MQTIDAQAQDAFELIETSAKYAKGAMMTSSDTQYLLVDGSQYSPSSRAIAGMESAYQSMSDEEWLELDQALDELIEGYETDDWSMGWEEGCLWLYSPEYEAPEA